MQQASEVGFFWIVVFDAFGKFAADQGATKRMAPEDRGIDDPFVLRDQIAETVAEQDVFDALDAESEDGGLNGLGRASAGVERRIRDAQELRGDGLLVGDQLHDLAQLDFVRRPTKQIEQRLEHGRRGR